MATFSRSVFSTVDPETAREVWAPLVPRFEFGRVDPQAFRMRMRTASAPSFAIMDYTFSSPSTVEAGADQLMVVTGRGRGLEVRRGRSTIDTSRPYVNVADGLSATWQDFASRTVMLDRTRLHEFARMHTANEGARLELVDITARSASLGRHWDATVARIGQAIAAAPEAFEEPLVAEAAFSRLAEAYLDVFNLAWARPDGGLVPVGARSAAVRAALDFLHANAAKPISIQHVAEAVHISTRGLHAAFVAETGRPPSEHLRDIRLRGVRDELRFAPPSDTIAVVARRWGFVHLPRFAQAYQQAYGELPSATRGRKRPAG
ncbi:helix-turn-helix transcriptional regulator [Agromyces arachidis]|uniref:helix-turn-helix transcriptional regulator n=1 Tax=Agromyces arachidis TaxID=766966 RepID=UPI004056CEED